MEFSEKKHKIYALWDRLSEFEVAEADASMRFLLQGLCDLVSASTGQSVIGLRIGDRDDDAVGGWRACSATHLHPSPDLLHIHRVYARLLEAGEMDVCTQNNIAGAGTWRVNRLVDLAPTEWFGSRAHQELYTSLDRHDAMWGGCPINDDAELYIGLFRGASQPPFTVEERELASFAMRGLKWYCRMFLLDHGLCVADAPLTPAERDVLRGLLRGNSEKEVAAVLGQSPHTTHGHVKAIYRKFNVKNRSSLMALWLGSRP